MEDGFRSFETREKASEADGSDFGEGVEGEKRGDHDERKEGGFTK